MFYISEKPTEFPGRTIYQVRNNHDHPDTHATDRVVVTTLDETAAMAIAWAIDEHLREHRCRNPLPRRVAGSPREGSLMFPDVL
jgi:hypothetical protein